MSSSSRKALFFILLVALAYVSYAYMIKPANKHLADQRAKVTQKQAKLAELYPADKATGFKPGDMRGAILVSWPVGQARGN